MSCSLGTGEDTVLVLAFEAEWKSLGKGVGRRAFQARGAAWPVGACSRSRMEYSGKCVGMVQLHLEV